MLTNKTSLSYLTYGSVIIMGLAMSVLGKSFELFLTFAGIALVCAALSVSTRAIRNKTQNELHVVIAVIIAGGLILGAMGALERLLWTSMSEPPAFLVDDDFGDRYDANAHRYVRELACYDRGMLEIYAIGDVTYVRCGSIFPALYTAKMSTEAYKTAVAAAADIPEHSPIIIPQL